MKSASKQETQIPNIYIYIYIYIITIITWRKHNFSFEFFSIVSNVINDIKCAFLLYGNIILPSASLFVLHTHTRAHARTHTRREREREGWIYYSEVHDTRCQTLGLATSAKTVLISSRTSPSCRWPRHTWSWSDVVGYRTMHRLHRDTGREDLSHPAPDRRDLSTGEGEPTPLMNGFSHTI